jgi:SAM-dependent methyltransferase
VVRTHRERHLRHVKCIGRVGVAVPQRECPVCHGRKFDRVISARAVSKEIDLRRDFILPRIGRKPSRAELKDLLDFMHGFPAPLFSCRGCNLLIRGEQRVREARAYEADPNDQELMRQVMPRYVKAFRNKREAYGDLLRPHADVLEIGPHLGAFLQTAEEWNWRATGLDVGKDTTEFIRSRGFAVRRDIVEQARFPSGSFDGVFIWNCFEQLPEPGPTLAAVHRLLRRHGLLVVRVPNAWFYRFAADPCRRDEFETALAYNNLLGFPYLFGYTAETLNRLILRYGFRPVRGFNSELVTMPFADLTGRIRSEQANVSENLADWSPAVSLDAGTLAGPWIELLYRKLEEEEWSRWAHARPAKVIALPRRRIDRRFLKRAA